MTCTSVQCRSSCDIHPTHDQTPWSALLNATPSYAQLQSRQLLSRDNHRISSTFWSKYLLNAPREMGRNILPAAFQRRCFFELLFFSAPKEAGSIKTVCQTDSYHHPGGISRSHRRCSSRRSRVFFGPTKTAFSGKKRLKAGGVFVPRPSSGWLSFNRGSTVVKSTLTAAVTAQGGASAYCTGHNP